jgi:hypothetical protein
MTDDKNRADMTDEQLDEFEYLGCSSGTSTPPMVRNAILQAVAEIRRHRAAQTANEEQACEVGERDAAVDHETELHHLRAVVAVIMAAEAWLDDPCKGLGSHREIDLALAVKAYRAGHVSSKVRKELDLRSYSTCPACGVPSSVTFTREEERFPYGSAPHTVELTAVVDKGRCSACTFVFTDARAEKAYEKAVQIHLEARKEQL